MTTESQSPRHRIHARLLGAVELSGPAGTHASELSGQPMKVAVLAWMAVESLTGFVSRDRLALTFWPESDTTRSRRSLNQLLYSLRQALGVDFVERRGDDLVAVKSDVLDTDVAQFLEASASDQPEEALRLYRGEFLDGIYIARAPDFERWLDARRGEYRATAARSAWQLAERRAGDGRLDEAEHWSAKAVSLAPYDEAAMRRHIRFLDGLGRRSAAISAFTVFEHRMRADLELEPSPETRAVVDEVRSRDTIHGGFTPESIPVIVPADAEAEPFARASTPRDTPSPPPPRKVGWRMLAGALGALVLVAMLTVRLWHRSPSQTSGDGSSLDPRRVAVMFFDDVSPDSSLGWMARALTRDLIHDLSEIDTLRVVNAAGVEPFRGRNLPMDSIARSLQAGILVDGTIRNVANDIEVTVQITDASKDFRVISYRIEKPQAEILDVQRELLYDVTRFLRTRVGHAVLARQQRERADNPHAWTLVQRGQDLLDEGISLGRYGAATRAWSVLHVADSLFEVASRLSPRWVDPVLLRARVARARFLSLSDSDPVAGQGPGSAGMIAMAHRVLSRGLELSREAQALAPDQAEARTLEAYFLYTEWWVDGESMSSPLFADVQSRLQDIVTTSPDQSLAWLLLSRLHLVEGDTSAADDAARRAFDADPFLWETRRSVINLVRQEAERGRFSEARRLCARARSAYQDDAELLECGLLLLAWTADQRDSVAAAWKELEAVESVGMPSLQSGRTVRRMYVAAAAARTGLRDSARAIVARAYAERGPDRPDSTDSALAEAWVYTLAGQGSAAIHVLDSIVTSNPDIRERIATHAWYRALRDDPRFRRLTSASVH